MINFEDDPRFVHYSDEARTMALYGEALDSMRIDAENMRRIEAQWAEDDRYERAAWLRVGMGVVIGACFLTAGFPSPFSIPALFVAAGLVLILLVWDEMANRCSTYDEDESC